MASFICPSKASIDMKVINPDLINTYRGDYFVLAGPKGTRFLGRYSAYNFEPRKNEDWCKTFIFRRPHGEMTSENSISDDEDEFLSYIENDFDIFEEQLIKTSGEQRGSISDSKLYLIKYHKGSVNPEDYVFIETKAAIMHGRAPYHETF